jgi:hypothetical protein
MSLDQWAAIGVVCGAILGQLLCDRSLAKGYPSMFGHSENAAKPPCVVATRPGRQPAEHVKQIARQLERVLSSPARERLSRAGSAKAEHQRCTGSRPGAPLQDATGAQQAATAERQ